MVEIAVRVRRAWCDMDHDSERSLSTNDTELENLSPTWCWHGYAKPWKSGESEWGLEGWLALLAFVCDRTENPDGSVDYFAEVRWNKGRWAVEAWGREWDGIWFDSDDDLAYANPDSLREAVILAIDAIEQHREQEGDE